MDAGTFGLLRSVCFFTVVFAAIGTDLTEKRIRNLPLVVGAALGIAFSAAQGLLDASLAGNMVQTMAGGLAGLAIGFTLYWLGGIGAGDGKFLAAIGFLTSFSFLLWTMAYTALAGFALAIVVLARQGGAGEALKGCFGLNRKQRMAEIANPASKRTVPYGLAIGAGALMAIAHLAINGYPLPWANI